MTTIDAGIFLGGEGQLPEYKTAQSAGADLRASCDLDIEPGEAALVGTGVFLEIPDGYEAQVRSRSGLALKNSVFVLNSPGTIDSDYRGEVGVILFNAGRETFKVSKGDRIAQLVVAPVVRANFVSRSSLKELSVTDRGSGGFGSTGV